MNEIHDPSKDPQNAKDLIRLAKDVDFIHLGLTDIHGMFRMKVIPSDEIEAVISDGITFVVCALSFATDGNVVAVPSHVRMNFGNIRAYPIIGTTRNWPWWNLSTDTSALQIFASTEWMTGEKVDSDPRLIAMTQVKRMHDRGLDIYWGTECEFRLFERASSDADDPIPATNTLNLFLPQIIALYERFYVEMNRRMRALGFKFDAFHSEYGHGQVEFVMTPTWGIKHADDLIRFKMLARDVARENGYKVSFMSKPIPSQTGNGMHLSHSIWRRKDGSADENVMYDPNDEDKMSSFAKHWLAGLLHHVRGFTALTSPTVNCYRRLHNPWCPTYVDWGVDNRFSSFRFKSMGDQSRTYLENRSPSAAANPYLALAATIAAGLDGVDNKLPLVAAGSKEMGLLPRTLFEAVEEMNKDQLIESQFGTEFTDVFGVIKLDEMKKLQNVDLTQEKAEDFRHERKLYFDFV